MDILYFVGQFPKLSESFIINELHELQQGGHDISVFSLRRPEEEITHDEVQEMDLTIHYGEIPSYSSLPELFSKRVSMDRRDDLEYHTTIPALEPGEYNVHVVAQSETENVLVNRTDVIGLSDAQTVEVTEETPDDSREAEETEQTDDSTPGFGAIAAVIALSAAAVGVIYRRS